MPTKGNEVNILYLRFFFDRVAAIFVRTLGAWRFVEIIISTSIWPFLQVVLALF